MVSYTRHGSIISGNHEAGRRMALVRDSFVPLPNSLIDYGVLGERKSTMVIFAHCSTIQDMPWNGELAVVGHDGKSRTRRRSAVARQKEGNFHECDAITIIINEDFHPQVSPQFKKPKGRRSTQL